MTVFSFSKGSSTVFSLPPFSLGGEGRGDLQVVTKVVPLCKNGKKMEECSYIIHNICVLLSLLATNLLAQEIKKKMQILNLRRTEHLCWGVWFPAHSNITCTGKGVKISQPISVSELTGVMILLADWRC